MLGITVGTRLPIFRELGIIEIEDSIQEIPNVYECIYNMWHVFTVALTRLNKHHMAYNNSEGNLASITKY